MKNINLLMVIFEAVCGLVCVGVGIYYAVVGMSVQCAVFLVVGAVCAVIAVRGFITVKKSKRDDNNDNSKK